MSTTAEVSEAAARYISVEDVAYEPARGLPKISRKQLLTTDRLQIHQTSIGGHGDGDGRDCGFLAANSVAYVLSGTAVLEQADLAEPKTQLGRGHLMVIPPGTRRRGTLTVTSDELVLLEVARALEPADGSEDAAGIRVVDPEAVAAYEPAGHARTRNRCLFVDEHMEIIEGRIERGGGADRHSHDSHEQLLYVLSGAGVPLLIHYPKGAPHGTGGGVPEPLELLVIYSPPLGEAQNALA